MQKINSIHYALLIFVFSGAAITHATTPESIAAALNFCQQRFNTSDQNECQKLIEAKFTANFQETFSILSRTNFITPLSGEDAKTMERITKENNSLGKHLPALRNDQLTPEQTFEAYVRLLTRTIKRCNEQAAIKDVSHCYVNGWLDDFKMMLNTQDAIQIAQSSFSIELFDILAAYSQVGLEKEIKRRESTPEAENAYPLRVDTLKALLEQVNAARVKLAEKVVPFVVPAQPSEMTFPGAENKEIHD
jgi:hypothetical protein